MVCGLAGFGRLWKTRADCNKLRQLYRMFNLVSRLLVAKATKDFMHPLGSLTCRGSASHEGPSNMLFEFASILLCTGGVDYYG